MPKIIESYHEFAVRHGGNAVYDPKFRAELFPDGAVWRGPRARMGVDQYGNSGGGTDPPTGVPLLHLRHRYTELTLQRELAAFECAKADYTSAMNWHTQYNNCPPPPAGAEECLDAGKLRIAKLQAELKSLQDELDNLPEAIARREYEESQRQRYLVNHERLSRLTVMQASKAKAE